MATLILNNTTSPVSGSGQLAFNTTKNTLVVGNGTAEISMATTGSNVFTGDQSITGSLGITGNLTLGGTITIGDNASDNVVVNADLSSSIIPNNDNAFDLGSASYRYKDIYGVNIYGAIKATNGVVSGSSQTIANLPTGTVSSSAQTIANLPTGTLSGSSQITYENISSIPAGIVSGSSQVTPLLPTGVISGSSQLSGTTITNLTITNLTTVNETASVIFSSGSNRFGDFGDDVHDFTGSVKVSGSITTIGSSTATSFNGTINANNGVVSGSSQITYENISSIPAGIVSGSAQVTPLLPTGTVSGSVQVLGGTGIVSGSSQITYENISSIPAGIVSGSSQITTLGFVSSSVTASSLVTGSVVVNVLTFTKGDGSTFDLTIAASGSAPAGTVSGSAQIIENLPTGVVSGSSQLVGILGSLNTFSASASSSLGDIQNYTASLRGAITINGSDVSIAGGLTVLGTTTIIDTTTLAIKDNIIELNAGGGINGGLVVRDVTGTTTSGSLLWDTANDYWIAGPLGSEAKVLTDGMGLISGSGQLGNYETTGRGIVSGSSQVTPLLPTGVVSGSAQTIANLPTGVVSSSLQTIANLPAGTVSGSSQITYENISSIPAGIVSGSAQVTPLLPTGTVSGSAQTIINLPTGVVSGSSQILDGSTIHSSSIGDYQFNSIGVGIAASALAGEIIAINDITAFYSSDIRLKENIQPIQNALEKVESISGNTYDWKEGYDEIHSHKGNDVGVIAQEIEEILPQIVTNRDNGYKAVQYEKIVPLLIEAIKELSAKIKELENK